MVTAKYQRTDCGCGVSWGGIFFHHVINVHAPQSGVGAG